MGRAVETIPQPAHQTERAEFVSQPVSQSIAEAVSPAVTQEVSPAVTQYETQHQPVAEAVSPAVTQSIPAAVTKTVTETVTETAVQPSSGMPQGYRPPVGASLATDPYVKSYAEVVVHSQHNCLYIESAAMERLQHEVSVARLLQPGTYTITLKSGSFDYQIESGHQGEPLVLLWIYGGKVVNSKTGVEVGATWSSLNGYGDTMTLEVREPASVCGFFFDTYLEDNEGAVTVGIEGAGYSKDIVVDSRHNCYFIEPDTMHQLEQQTSVSKTLAPGTYAIKIKNGAFSYRSELGRPGEPLMMFWIYGGTVVNQKTGVEVGATWSSLNGYNDMLMLEVRQPTTICAFFFDTYLDDNQGEVTLSIARF